MSLLHNHRDSVMSLPFFSLSHLFGSPFDVLIARETLTSDPFRHTIEQTHPRHKWSAFALATCILT